MNIFKIFKKVPTPKITAISNEEMIEANKLRQKIEDESYVLLTKLVELRQKQETKKEARIEKAIQQIDELYNKLIK
jgi:hypothetical protein